MTIVGLHRHRWTHWHDYDQPLMNLATGRRYTARFQYKRCVRCQKRKERQV